MSHKSKRKFMDNLERCYKLLQQSSSKGIRAVEVASKLGVHRTTAHSYLNTLELMGKVYSEHGLWYAKDRKDESIGEKEIELTIKLPPLDEEERQREAELRYIAEKYGLESLKLRLKFLEELRTIKIKGKNIEDIKEQLPKLIIETLEKTRKESKSLWKRKIKLPF
ncbi:HTH domain-containing protein [Candidatus Bathyarchaeota archaeon]|nr:HTH domain-containing protein [Candidatus Bathyarchaeota archaeon]